MKKLVWMFCFVLVPLYAQAAFDMEKFCRSDVEQNTARAEWGLQLRAQMLQVCGKKPSKSCMRPYVDAIAKQKDTDTSEMIRLLNKHPDVNEVTRQSMITSIGQWEQAAEYTLHTGESAQRTANLLYSRCTGTAVRGGGAQYSAPATSGYSEQSGCTNYTVMGQSGRTEYCQKCCYGGNCQVYCN